MEEYGIFISVLDLGDVVEIVYLLIDLFTIFDTADVEIASAFDMEKLKAEKCLMSLRKLL